jgi:hypothetical protein
VSREVFVVGSQESMVSLCCCLVGPAIEAHDVSILV